MILILAVTVVGLPLAIIAGVSYVMAVILAKVFTAYWLGALITKMVKFTAEPKVQYLVGLVVFYVLLSIPGFGGLVWMLATIFGFGLLVVAKWQTWKLGREKKVF